jgi:serine protease Do
MTSLRLSRTTVGLVFFAVAALVILLLSTVRVGGQEATVADPPAKKADKPDNPLSVKGQLDENDPNDPVRNQPCKTYEVKLKKGRTYVIDMVTPDFDAYLRLDNAKGEQVAEDDDSGGDLNAQIVFTPEEDATFKVIATRFAEGTGTFTLKVSQLVYKTPARAQTVGNDGTLKIQEKLTKDDPQDPLGPRNAFKLYSVQMKAGRIYTIDLVSNEFDAFLRLMDAKFTKLAEDDDGGGDLNSRIVFTPKADGVYHIVATTLDGDVGNFTLTVREEEGK